jgi:hypothetical protein
MRRQALALVLFGLLAVSAGCTGVFGPDQVDEEQVSEDYQYNWNTTQKVTINVTGDQYRAVYDLQNRSELVVYTRDFTGEQPLPVSSLQYQYPNGTVTRIPAAQVENRQEDTVISLPARRGKVAFSAPTASGKQVTVPTFVTGSYEVILPQGMRASVPVLSQIRPGADTRTIENGQVHIRWEDVEANTVSVSYYLGRDIWIFGGVIVLLLLIGGGGLAYYVLQIRQLEDRRAESGLDIDNRGD